jgi:beta-lactamase class A
MKLSRSRITWILRAAASAVSAALVIPSSSFSLSPAIAQASGLMSASSVSGTVTVTCAGVGDLRVIVSAHATPAPATPLPSGVSLRTAYRATDSRTAATVSGGERGDIACSEVAVNGVAFGALSNGTAPAGVDAGDLFDGTVTISLVATEPSLVATPPRLLAAAAVPGAGAPFPFAAALQSYVATRSGRVSAAVFDATDGATYSYNAGAQHMTASIVKVAILGTLLRQAQDAHRALTSTERSVATRMIEQSDNNAATTLWNEVGQGPGVKTFMSKVGMPSTTPGTDGLWGLTSTNAPDQVSLVRRVAYPNAVLADSSRAYMESLMRAVTPSQKWGVSAGLAAGTTVALKNGWLPRSDGWVINSIGHVRGGTHDYVIAVLQSGDPAMSYGINTVEHVSGLVWAGLRSTSGVFSAGDFTGDVMTDILGVTANGDLYLYRGNGRGGFTGAGTKIGAGWGIFTKVFSAGDFTGDGKTDILGVTANGDLYLYRGNGLGGFTGAGTKIGAGWGIFTKVFSAGDFTGDGKTDILGVTADGDLYLYRGNGLGGFTGAGTKIGAGWNIFP